MSEIITIGITCYNAESTIIRAIESAVAQDYPNKEILVVNDSSTDNSEALIRDYIDQNPGQNIRYICHEKNKGFPSALNTLLRNATGSYIAFFDDDDVSVADRLTKQMIRLKEYASQKGTEDIFCYTNRMIYPNIGTPHIAQAIGRVEPEPHGNAVADHILWRSYENDFTWGLFGSCTLLVRTGLLKDTGYFDEEFRRSAELDMAIRASMSEAHFIAVNEPLVAQYKTATSDKAGKIPLKYNMKLRYKHKDYLVSKGVYWAACCLAHFQYHWNKRDRIRMTPWIILAALCAPKKIFWARFKNSKG
ncbi:MAG: hypothetical protein DI626_10385 [Micavibrio aeruginosavorus]|uniref:Glycosyltransferase 2-like domain-containing protein n=1 Tax=Micavibrio aeruginosavorus TaxID=349221 RepID=A0A2W4ZLB5_9BACT|nr:MAG: hypothetical protein DI626_10385 [Micavibrio aeruginosavorus]